MNRVERIRFYITEQCRRLDPTFRSCLYPTQILLGDIELPMLPDSTLTFRVNQDKNISFRIRVIQDESGEPMNIGIPLNQVEGMSLKDRTKKHPVPAVVFLLKPQALKKLVKACPFLDDSLLEGPKGRMLRYLTVICGIDKNFLEKENKIIHNRILSVRNKFTFAFRTAKKVFMKDFPLMWNESIEHQNERRVKTGIHHDREIITEMNDDAWDWFMGFLKTKLEWNREKGFLIRKNNAPIPPKRVIKKVEPVVKKGPPTIYDLHEILLEREMMTAHYENVQYEEESDIGSASDSESSPKST